MGEWLWTLNCEGRGSGHTTPEFKWRKNHKNFSQNGYCTSWQLNPVTTKFGVEVNDWFLHSPNWQTEAVNVEIPLLQLDVPTETQTLETHTQEYEYVLDTSDVQIPNEIKR
jgi:hypothetical protein